MSRWRCNPWAVLLTLSLGFFMTLLDITVVNVAIPSMIDRLHASLDEMLWVINVYILVLAALLITSGRLGDVLGPRTMFIGGVAVFTVASALLLAMFLIYQRSRQDDEPLLPFVLFRDRGYAVMSFVSATVQVGMIGLFRPVMIYLQSVLGFSAFKAGLVMAPAMVVSAVLSPIAGRMADRLGGEYILMTGLALFAVGMAWLTWVIDGGRAWWEFQPALVVAGAGIGCAFGPMVTVAMRNVQPEMAGAASGVLNTIRQIGTISGSAAVGAVLQNRLAAALHTEAARQAADLPPSVRDQFMAGFNHAGKGGLEVGTGQTGAAPKPPPGTPTSLAQHMNQTAESVFEHGFVHAMRPTLALPIAVIAVGAVSCLLARRRPADDPSSVPDSADIGTSA